MWPHCLGKSDGRCENEGFVRDFLQKVEVQDVINEAFVQDILQKVKVEDVKTQVLCETSLKK